MGRKRGVTPWWHRLAALLGGPVMLVVGAAWDLWTLDRIDRLSDNLVLLAYLVGLGLLLVVNRRVKAGRLDWPWLAHLGTQFLFGGLFSAYVIYYAKSTALGRAGLYVAVLLTLLVINELAHRALRGDLVRSGLFFLCGFSFFLFFVPVVSGQLIGFAVAGALAMALSAPVVAGMQLHRKDLLPAFASHLGLHVALLIVLVGAGRLGLIPPVPLGLKHGALVRTVERTEEGYTLVSEPPEWPMHTVLHWQPGESVACFTAIFAPTGMGLDVWHRWEWWDPEQHSWVLVDRIAWELHGGRDAGFRGYTRKENLRRGYWRVVVELEDGRELGELDMELRRGPATETVTWTY